MQASSPEAQIPVSQRTGWREVGGFVVLEAGSAGRGPIWGMQEREDTRGLVHTPERTLAHQTGETEGKPSSCDSPNHGLLWALLHLKCLGSS